MIGFHVTEVKFQSTKGVAPPGHSVTHERTRVDCQARFCWNERNWVTKMRTAVGMPDATVRQIKAEI